MATFLFLVQLLFIGTLIVPAYTDTERCNLLLNATAGNLTVIVKPEAYKANTTYQVTIHDDRNHTDSKNVTAYLLQALTPQNYSIGEWDVVYRDNCSSIDTAILNDTLEANWTSPNSNISSVVIRVYIAFADKSVEFKTVTLNKESETTTAPTTTAPTTTAPTTTVLTTTAPPTTTPNSVPTVQSSSFFIAVIQLPLLLVTSKLLS